MRTSALVLHSNANPLQRAVRRFAATGPGAWLFARAAHRLDRRVFRLTRGRHTLANLVSGLPVVMLTTTGVRSGRPRTVPVLGLPISEGIAVIASNFGRGDDPAWCRNLRADPLATVAVAGEVRRVRAIEAHGPRRAQIMHEGLRVYPGWARYARRAANRRIAVFVLSPLDGPSPPGQPQDARSAGPDRQESANTRARTGG